MKLLTAEQMRQVDRRTVKELGIPGTTLMENAGIGVVQILEEHVEQLGVFRVAVVCGRGNNGGDGFVIARQLYMRGIVPDVYIVCPAREIRDDARVNFEIVKNYGEIPIIEIPDKTAFKRRGVSLAEYHLIIDAILGTGLSKPVEGYLATVIEAINNSPAKVVAVDIPSGLYADEYIPVETAVYADLTVTFTAAKPGLLLGEAGLYTGDLYTVAIGSPDRFIDLPEHHLNWATAGDVKSFFLPRKKTSHKGNYGHVLVVGGGRGKTGAVRLAGMAALRGGVGLATLAVPDAYAAAALSDCPELMAEPLLATPEGFLDEDAVPAVLALLAQRDLLVLGPGLGHNASTQRFVLGLLPRLEVPAVIDADALNCLADDIRLLQGVRVPLVLTPHPGEMARLMGCSTGEVQESRETFAREFARTHGVYLILKGHRTVTADPEGAVWINPTGNPGMATAGSGDVLSGLLGAFCARINHQNPEAWLLACTAAVHVHGLAGDLAAEAFTEEALIARDLINQIHAALQKIAES
jgi:hydroxyethylthiazole kinase-like uncharacterized protein yjeF